MNTKDITPTLFGLVVAYLLPGLFALVTIALFADPVADLLRSFGSAQSTAGLFLFVVLISLLLGMQLSACRWLLFEKWIFKDLTLASEDFRALRSLEIAASFRMAIDELNRYHQFFGAQVFVIPFFFLGLGYRLSVEWISWWAAALLLVGGALEVVTWQSAASGWRRYVERGRSILRGE